jgi:phosphoribosylaminoimidazole-succinocarboxamide synthase
LVTSKALLETSLPNPFHKGKVRDTYDLGDALLMVATDRVSAFDSVLPTGIPGRGIVLAELSALWFKFSQVIVPNHYIGMAYETGVAEKYGLVDLDPEVGHRAMVVRKAERIDVECVIRGYITGSAWAEYQRSGTMNSAPLPEGMQESQEFGAPVFTPTTKAETGHDEPLTLEQLWDQVGGNIAWPLEEHSLALYDVAAGAAKEVGFILADTKFEFGFIDGKLHLIDEVLTPDSSRYWDVEGYQVGKPQPSFDKQIIRDWLTETGWNREPPAPELPDEIVQRTMDRYREVYSRLSGGKELPA